MCYRTEGDIEIPELAKARRKSIRDANKRLVKAKEFNGFAHPYLPVSTTEEPNIIEPMKWGLIPFWIKDETKAKESSNKCLNAKGETILELPSFRSIAKKRCVIYVSGFYEWQHVDKEKIKYLIKVKEEPFFGLGGLYDEWTDKITGEPVQTFSIITCPANELMSKIHNTAKRMPFILKDEEAEREWLLPELTKEEIQKSITQFPTERMQAEVA